MTFMEEFRNPGVAFRGAPFWAWNGKLDPMELVRQIRVFNAMGYGGFFMHARVGLGTEYLGPEWFACVRTCIDEARRLGMKAYLYDEDRWPSGAAGGLVTADDRYKMRFCKVEVLERAEEACLEGRTLAWFQARVRSGAHGLEVVAVERLKNSSEFKGGDDRRLLRFVCVLAHRSPWFNGETYLDTLNPAAVRAFLESTHEAYAREIGDAFGDTVPAIFSDEPSFSHDHGEFPVPWTERLPELFQQRYGRDLLDLLPELFFVSLKRLSGARRAFMDLVTSLFVESFSCQIGAWCQSHGLQMTGHVLMEDSLFQAYFVGAAMRFYEHMQLPGIDLLTEHWRNFNAVKQCTSMAHQFGRRRRLTEIYGCTGWDFPFMGHKALGDWQYALGINFRCQHLAWYTSEGEAKRDYPSSLSYQSSWHGAYSVVEDYFARLGTVLSAGEEVIRLLVIHPIESAWMELDFGTWNRPLEEREKAMGDINHAFSELTDRLLSATLDFDFGDEDVLERHGAVEGNLLRVNCACYAAVLIPELHTIRLSTLRLLQLFAAQGGPVVFLGKPPRFLDGESSDVPEQVYGGFSPMTVEGAVELLSSHVRVLSIRDRSGTEIGPVLGKVTHCADGYSVFLVNYGAEFTGDIYRDAEVRDRRLTYDQAIVDIFVPESGSIHELDAVTGKAYAVEARYEGDHYRLVTSFDRLQSRLFLISHQVPEGCERRDISQQREGMALDTAWEYSLDEDNVLVLDQADWVVEGVAMGTHEFILEIDDRLRELMGVPKRGEDMVQPWKRGDNPALKPLKLTLQYEFEVAEIPPQDCSLALEHPERFQMRLNGRNLPAEVCGWWVDRSLQCIRIPASELRSGRNRLELSTEYSGLDSGLEACFLRGAFGVREDVLTALPTVLEIGDWVVQGLPYYAGNVLYSRRMHVPEKGGMLDMGEVGGVLAGITVNDGPEQLLPWPPFVCRLPAGEVRLTIKVYGSRRNAMGPFFCRDMRPIWTGPCQFRERDVKQRRLIPSGLLKAPVFFES